MPERGLQELAALLQDISSSAPTPGGGSVAAIVGALAASLGAMAASIRASKTSDNRIQSLAKRFFDHQAAFLRLSADDEAAFEEVMAAFQLSNSDEAKSSTRERALLRAAEVPLALAARCCDLLDDLAQMVSLATTHSVSDVGAAAHLARAAAESTLLNVEINAHMMQDEAARGGVRRKKRELELQCAEQTQTIVESVEARIQG